MSRSTAVIVLSLFAFPAGAQNTHGPNQKELARAKFEKENANLQDLFKKRADVARGIYKEEEKVFFRGRSGTWYFLHSALQFFDSEVALCSHQEERWNALERHWVRVKLMDEINWERFQLGRIGIRDVLQSRCGRLDAEIKLAGIKKTTGQLLFPGWDHQFEKGFSAKEIAQARFELTRANPRQLAQEKLEAAWTRYEAQEREFRAGRSSMLLFEDSSLSVLEAELGFFDKKADRIGSLERHWLRTKFSENENRERLEFGRIPFEEFWMVQSFRVKAEIELVKALKGEEFPWIPPGRPQSKAYTFLMDAEEGPNTFRQKELGKLLKNELNGGYLTQLIQEKRGLLRKLSKAREEIFLEGRGWLYNLLETSRDLLESELEQSDKKTHRYTALQNYLNRQLRYEQVNKERFEYGRISYSDYLQTVYGRLDAEIRLVQEKEKK
jgi:hypothetical protein